jgi:hypothetical protein
MAHLEIFLPAILASHVLAFLLLFAGRLRSRWWPLFPPPPLDQGSSAIMPVKANHRRRQQRRTVSGGMRVVGSKKSPQHPLHLPPHCPAPPPIPTLTWKNLSYTITGGCGSTKCTRPLINVSCSKSSECAGRNMLDNPCYVNALPYLRSLDVQLWAR